MTRLIVEAGFGYTVAQPASIVWTDISQYVDVVTGVSIGRGASDEVSEIQPATCSMVLDDSDGRFTPGRATSPYWPSVRKNTPIRVRVVSGGKNLVTNPSFETGLADWTADGGSPQPALTQSVGHVQHGTQAMLITWDSGASPAAGTTVYGLNIGSQYTASAYVWVPTGHPAAKLSIVGASAGTASAINDTYTRITYTFTATSTSHRLQVTPATTPTSGQQAWVDAVYVEEGAAATALVNYLANGDFETGVGSWTSSGPPTITQSSVRALQGTSSMLVTWGGVAGEGITSAAFTGLTVGATYFFTAYVWVPVGHASVNLAVSGVTNGAQNATFGAWERLSVSWTATSTSHQVRLKAFTTPAAGNQVWMDVARVDAVDGAQIHSRFYGMVNEWPLKLKGLQATTSIVCTDLFKWLSGQPSLGTMLSEEILYSGALAYYPLSEDSSATSAGDLAANGAQALAIVQMGSGGTLAFAGATGPAETGQSAPLFTPATASAGQYLKADLGPAAATATATQPGYIELWIQTSTTGRTFLASTTDDGTYQVVYGLQASTGLLEMRWTLDPTAAIADWGTGVDLSSGNLADGKLHHLVIGLFTADLWVDGVASNLPFGSKQPMRTLYLGGFTDGRLWSGTISNVALYASSSLTGTTLAPHYNAGATGYAGEAANVRIQRLAKYVGIATVTPVGTTFDPQASQGPGGSTALAMMQAVATTESARLSASRDSFGLTIMSRDIRYNPVADVSLSYPDLDTDSVEHSDDDQKMVNSVVASRPGGATQRVISQASIDAYGPKEQQLDLLKTSDNSVLDAANWLISRYADPPPELREIPIEAYTMGAATYRALLGLGISSIITVTDLPDQAPASVQTVFVEGYTETIRQASHLISFHASRSYNDSAWVLDDPTYSTLGSTTKLAY